MARKNACAVKLGRAGGIASGKVRRKKAAAKKKTATKKRASGSGTRKKRTTRSKPVQFDLSW